MLEHYSLAVKLLGEALLSQAVLGDGAVLAYLNIDTEHRYQLKLVYGVYPGKEGELSISLYDGSGTFLVRLCFSFIEYNQSHAIYIGGLQGANCANARLAINQASKACYGLAPKRIVLEAALALAKQTKAVVVLGVTDSAHTFKGKQAKYFSYDSFWAELGGVSNQQGDYVIPLEPPHKDYADTPRKRRAKYRRQHQILHEVNIQACTVLQGNSIEGLSEQYLELS